MRCFQKISPFENFLIRNEVMTKQSNDQAYFDAIRSFSSIINDHIVKNNSIILLTNSVNSAGLPMLGKSIWQSGTNTICLTLNHSVDYKILAKVYIPE